MMTVMLVITAVAVLATVEVGRLLEQSVRAGTAADAAALAGAADGRDEAAAIAAANGATLVSYAEELLDEDAGSVSVAVSVKVGRAASTARAVGVTEWSSPG